MLQRTPFLLLPFFPSDSMRVRSWWWSRSWLIEVALVTAMAAFCPLAASAQSLLNSSLDSYRLAAVPEPPAPPAVPSPPVLVTAPDAAEDNSLTMEPDGGLGVEI